MVTVPECEGPFLPLLRSIQDKSAPSDDHVDAYLRFTERLREEQDVFLSEVCNHIEELTVIFKSDIINPQTEVCQASLQALGHCLYQEQIARAFTETDSKDLLQDLAKVISTTEDKGVCTRALWCVAKQNLPDNIVSDQLSVILSSIECALKKSLQSITVDNEAICVVERLLQQLPNSLMLKNASQWSKLVFPLTVSSAGKVREHSLTVISLNLNQLISAREEILPWFLPVLKSGFISELAKLCSEKKELFVLRVWSCIVPVLGKALHRSSLINDVLKLVEQGFKNPSVSVQVESYFAWQVLIDNFAANQDVLSAPKRVNLIMMPLLNSAVKERNEKVEAARLSTWWHFVCAFETKRLIDSFEKICIPLLQFIFGTGIDHISLLKSKEGFGDLKCPPTPTNGKFISNSLFETPKATARRSLKDVGAPKTPTVIHASFAKASKDKLLIQGCEILEKLLSVDGSNSGNITYTLVDNLNGPVFQITEAFEKHSKVLMNAVREVFKACGKEIEDKLAMSIWSNLVTHVGNVVLKDRSSLFESHFLPLLAVSEELIEGDYINTTTSLKMLERVSQLTPHIISHHCTTLQSKNNPQGSTSILLLHLLLSPVLFKDGQNSERLFLTFENLLSCGIDTPTGQLSHIQAVLQLLLDIASFSEKKYSLWRLWSSTVSTLNEHIVKNNEVNQGNALDHDFTAVYLAFLLPAKHLLDASLGQGEIKSINKDLDELYRSFSRAAALVPSADANTCAEELCFKLLDNWNTPKPQDVSFLTGMTNLVTTILECMDYTVTPIFVSKSPIKSPSKWTKKLVQPLGNFTSTVELMRRLLVACYDMINTKESKKCSGILAALLTSLIDSLSVFYQHLNGASMIAAAIESLSHALVPIMRSSHISTKESKSSVEKAIFTSKFIQKVEKLWVDILTSVQARHGEPYSSNLLTVLSPLLEITFVHHRRQLKNQTIVFWNATFANSKTLEYPDSLRPILLSIKDKANLTLPGLEKTEVSVKETQSEVEIEEMSQMTQPQGSPIRTKPWKLLAGSPKVKGSFLHKAAEAEKAVEKSSPKKAWTEPRLPSKGKGATRNTHARRKLPLSLLDDDSQDFVTIAPSPTKKRLLTEHQKEVMREKSTVPALYNCLDQSQDGFYTTQEPSMCTPSPVEEQQPPFETKILPDTEHEEEPEKQNDEENIAVITEIRDTATNSEHKNDEERTVVDEPPKVSEIPETMETDLEDAFATTPSVTCLETPVKNQQMTSSSTSPSHMDKDIENKEDVTSPDVIPSSQISSESGSPYQFKSFRRSGCIPVSGMVVLLKDVTEKDKVSKPVTRGVDKEHVKELSDSKPTTGTSEKEPLDTKDSVSQENKTKVDDKDEESATKLRSSKKKKKKQTVKKIKISPIAGRTRRGRQLKLETPKRDNSESSENNTEDPTEISLKSQESSLNTQSEESSKDQESESRENPSDPLEPISDHEPEVNENPEVDQIKVIDIKIKGHAQSLLSKDVMSSPVSKIKFMKPNNGSPTQTSSIKAFHSPVSSPSTGILKRFTGRYDSPSPPNKVRRVSFAMPLAQEAQEKEVSVDQSTDKPAVTQSEKTESLKEPDPAITTPSKGSDSFTIIKRRRKTPSSNKEGNDDKSTCIYPELVDCSLPVEQILPSLCSYTWSRGLGHVIHAQNIRTIGNLSALKDYQIKNLPIKSPKVQTLRTALTSFHQKAKGLKSKSVKDISTALGKEKKLVMSDITSDSNVNVSTILESEDPTTNDCNDDKITNDQEKEDTVTDLKKVNNEELTEKTDINSENSLSVKEAGTEEKDKVEDNVSAEEQKELPNNEECSKGVEQEADNRENDDIPTVGASSGEQEEKDFSVKMSLVDENAEEVKESEHSVEISYTPPLPVPEECNEESDTLDEEVNSITPTRTARMKPVILFTPTDDESGETQAYNSTDVLKIIDDDLEKDFVVANSEQMEGNVPNTSEKEEEIVRECEDETVEQSPLSAANTDDEQKESEPIEDEPKNEYKSMNESRQDVSSDAQNKEEQAPEQAFCQSLSSILDTATPEVLAGLSNEEMFVAHNKLTKIMSRVVKALQEKMAKTS